MRGLFLHLLLACFAATAFAETIVSLDTRNRVLNTDTGNGLKVYRLAEKVEVRVNGVAGQIDQLKPGMAITLGFANPQTVNRIQAGEAAKAPIGNALGGRRILLKMKVDGDDFINVRDGKVWIDHKGWQNPSDIRVNGHSWKAVWNGKKSDEFMTFTPALVPFNGAVVELKKLSGRGSAVVTQQPTNENNQTLIVHVDDTPPQSGMYEISLSW
jgi:hypothetical protein